MKRFLSSVALAAAALLVLQLHQTAASAQTASASIKATKYVPVTEYDPKRDAATDINEAIIEAKRTKRNVLLEVGGKWCIWCRIMDEYFQKNADVLSLREKNYVTVKLNMSEENENKEVLSQYPAVAGYPHIFVLDASGKLLHSQNTGDLEAGRSYDHEKFIAFLNQWSPAR
jgi:thiol:disulfide interchange protein